MIYLLLMTLAASQTQEDKKKIKVLSETLDRLIKITESDNLSKIQEHVSLLEEEVLKAEKSIESLEDTISLFKFKHANFNSTHAEFIRRIVRNIEEIVEKIDEQIHDLDITEIKEKFPLAIKGQSTSDNQARNSVKKIKQESEKLNSAISSSSKFIWIWGIILIILMISIGIYLAISKSI